MAMGYVPCWECIWNGECDYQVEEDKEGCYIGEREDEVDE